MTTTNEKQLKKRSFKSQTGGEGALASSAAFPTKHKCFYFPVTLVFVSSQNALNSKSEPNTLQFIFCSVTNAQVHTSVRWDSI